MINSNNRYHLSEIKEINVQLVLAKRRCLQLLFIMTKEKKPQDFCFSFELKKVIKIFE
jgi:hypothetical protein